MNLSGLGGIAIAIIAAVTLLVFVPNWANGEVSEPKTERKRPEPAFRNPQAKRLSATARFSAAVATVGFTASVLVLVFALNYFALVVLTALSISATLLAVNAFRALKKLEMSKPQRVNRRLSFENETKIDNKPATVVNQRAWRPTALPDPLSNRVGELRRVAPVISFETVKADASENSSSENPTIDVIEILKRRRAI